ncbi:MAG: ABC transporter substrate-binding protein, partial [Thermoprotei archaeon]
GGNDLVFNCKSDWVSQLEVRQAIIHAINRTAVVAASGMQPYYTTLEYPISYNPWAYSDLGQNFLATLSKYPYNLTKAKELMEAAGYELKQGQWYAANGTPVSLTILASSSTTSGPSLSELEDVESQLKTFGFPTTLLITSNPSYAETGNGFNLYWGSWGWWGPAWEVFIFPAALDNGMAGSYYENFLQPVYVPGVGNVTFIQLFTRVRAGTSNLTQEEVWIKGLAYIENHYVTDIPIDGEAGIYGVNSKDVIWITNNSQINLIEGGGQIILLEAQLGLLHLPIKSIIVLAPASANIGQPVNITATAYTVNSWVAPATELNFLVNGVKVGSATTNYNGTASITYTPTSAGTYSVQVQPAFNTSITGTASLTASTPLVPSSISVTLTPASVTAGTPVTLSATVTASSGQPMPNTPVNFLVNGASVGSAVTNSNGVATLTYTPTSAGTYSVQAQSAVKTSVTGTATLTASSPPSSSAALYEGIAAAVVIVIVVVAAVLLLARRKPEGTKK